MPIAESTLQTLEFPRIREHLARYTAFSASRVLALDLLPTTDREEACRRLRLTGEARHLLDERPETSVGGARDIRALVQRAERGGVLEASNFLDIARTLRSMRDLHTLLFSLDEGVFPLLTEYTNDLPQLADIEQEVARTISDEGMVLDSASPDLARLRSEIQTTTTRMQDRLHHLVTSSRFEGILQEAIITVRNGRYVVPVKAGHRRSLPGLVHDQSSSGATLYIEPMAVVEMNNRLRELQLAEEQEINRMLTALSLHVGRAASDISRGVETLALLDLCFAQARYALDLRAIEPELDGRAEERAARVEGDEPASAAPPFPLYLKEARHPLLDPRTVVPVDVWLGDEFQLLLITGPNTGGKTVALKTVGLLALMAQAGLHIPARAPSRLPVFSHVFADIGDEQSIEQNLSTFSSHMTTIIRMLAEIERGAAQSLPRSSPPSPRSSPPTPYHTLVLLDEIGAGTDPVEGAALARAIIERLRERNCLGIITTHYAELKAFAYNTPGVQNASVEFDETTLAPTYELTIGLPGRSNALAIAARLGLDPALVERAGSMMTHETLRIEGLLEDIHRKREDASAALQRADEIRSDAEKYRERLSQEMRAFEETRQEQLNQALRLVEDEIREARAELHRLRKEVRGEATSRQKIQESEQQLQHIATRVEQASQKAQPAPPAEPAPLQVGDVVRVRSIGLTGEIVSFDEEDETVEVQVGGFRVKADLRELRPEQGDHTACHRESSSFSSSSSASSSAPAPSRSVAIPEMPDVSMTLDMRGWRTSEVAPALERYLNDAYLANLPSVRLIHGRGSGALRKVVQSFLRSHPLVASFDRGGDEGGEGVTVARLVER
jgi:DNA mismatch repair protein MutS2